MKKVKPWKIFIFLGLLFGLGFGLKFGLGSAHPSFVEALIILTVGGGTLALCGYLFWKTLLPLVQERPPQDEGALGFAHKREIEREKQLALKAIREIEVDHQMRKISDEDYRSLSKRYRTRAIRLIKEIDDQASFRSLIEKELKSRIKAMKTS